MSMNSRPTLSTLIARALTVAGLALALVMLVAPPAVAVNFDSYTTQTFAGPADAGSFNATVIPGLNRYLLVGYQHERSATPGREVQTLTYGGTPLTLAHREVNATTQEISEIWYLPNPPVGSASVAATLDGATESGRGFRLTAINLSGAAQTAPEAVAGTGAAGNSASTPIVTLTDNAALIGFTHNQANNAHTPGAGVTEIFDLDAVSIRAALGTRTQATAGATTFDWSWAGGTSTLNAQSVAAIAPVDDPTFVETTVSVDIGQVNQTAAGVVQAGFVPWDFADNVSSDTLTLTDPFGTGDVDVTLATDSGNFGTSTGTRDRGAVSPTASPLSDMLRDFVFEVDGSSVTLTFAGLPAGDYAIDLFHHDDDFVQGNADVSLTDDLVTALAIGNANSTTNADLPDFGTFSTYLLSNGVDPVSLQFDTNGNHMFNGFELTRLEAEAVPEPASIALWALIGIGLVCFGYGRLRRKR